MLLACSPLPSCATHALWGYSFPGWRPLTGEQAMVELAGQERTEQEIGLSFAANGNAMVGLAHQPGESCWRLLPVAGAEVVAALLGENSLVADATVRVDATRYLLDDQLTRAEATLVVAGRLVPSALGEPLEGVPPPAVVAALAASRRDGFAFAAEPSLHLPRVLQRCMQRLLAADVGALVGDGPARVEAFAFVDPLGAPRSPAGADDLERAEIGVQRLRECLARWSVILSVRSAQRTVYLRLPADRLWLWAECAVQDGSLRHESTWQLETVLAPAAVANERQVTAHFVCTKLRYRHTDVIGSPDTWAKVLLTPVTVLLDVTVLAPWNLVVAWMAADDDEDDARPLRR